MFQNLKREINERFDTTEEHFRLSPKKPANIAQTVKGLMFIEIYAIWEFTLRETVLRSNETIASHRHKLSELRPSLLALFLDAQINSLRDCSEKKNWVERLRFFNLCLSDDLITTVDVIPHDGSHYRHTQVEMIFRVLGISKAFVMRKRHLYMIDEIVNNRNSVAHGQETPLEIGRQFTREDMVKRLKLMRSICLRIVSIVQEYCGLPNRHKR
jgi:hypothetical protein